MEAPMIREILQHFNDTDSLPVFVDDVREHLVKIGHDDEITFHLVDMNPDIVRGVLYSYHRADGLYSPPVTCAEICIAKDQPPHWMRLVAIKEMLHTVDCEAMTASEEDTVLSLLEALALPAEIRPENQRKSYVNDKTRIYLALAVMLPKPFREKFRALTVENVLTHLDIARISGIPARFIPAILSYDFEEYIESLVAWEEEHKG